MQCPGFESWMKKITRGIGSSATRLAQFKHVSWVQFKKKKLNFVVRRFFDGD